MLVSHNSAEVDLAVGQVLKTYMDDPSNLFIISSDFCHWGRRFAYTGYVGSEDELKDALQEETEIEMLTARSKLSHHQIDIWENLIEILDKMAMKVLSDTANEARYNAWKQYLEITGKRFVVRDRSRDPKYIESNRWKHHTRSISNGQITHKVPTLIVWIIVVSVTLQAMQL